MGRGLGEGEERGRKGDEGGGKRGLTSFCVMKFVCFFFSFSSSFFSFSSSISLKSDLQPTTIKGISGV